MTAIPATMRVLVLEDFGTMALGERPVHRPGPGEVLVRVLATGICGSDLHGYTGENGRRVRGQVMGHETVGTVADVGPGVEALAVGEVVVLNPTLSCGRCVSCARGMAHICANRRVIGVDPSISSAFADYLLAPAANLVPFASEPLHGALVEPLAVGYHAAVRGSVGADDDVLVIGGGPIGQAVVLACRRLGARSVLVSEPDAARRELIKGLGAVVVDPAQVDIPRLARERTAGLGVTVAVDAVGTTATVRTALDATVAGGTCVLVGMAAPAVELTAFAVSTLERSVVGTFCYPAEEFTQTTRWAAEHPELLNPLISRTVAAEEAPAVFAAMALGDNPPGKVLVNFGSA